MIFHITPKDNDSYMAGSCDRVDPSCGVPTCDTCGYRTDLDFTSPLFKLRKKHLDVSCCYDGAVIVSERFRQLYGSLGGSNMHFVSLPAAAGFYHLKCIQTISLDYEAMGTQRSRPCSGCNRYLDIIGYKGISLHPEANLADNELAFSNWYFGSNNEASALVLCGSSLAMALRSSGFTGVDSYEPIHL
ncbi:hypothetical protein [Dyella sp. 20L07]|uniref:hypothetical protein n=1 Tax=Dyella sp. 20L07 TaxID=3384240 RepID=UPI003D2CBDF4